MQPSNLYEVFQATSKLLGKAQSVCISMELKHEHNRKIMYTESFCTAAWKLQASNQIEEDSFSCSGVFM